MNPVKRSLKTMGLLALLLLVGGFFSVLSGNSPSVFENLPTFWYIACGLALTLYFGSCVIDSRLRKYLTAIGFMIVFWILLRGLKYVSWQEIDTAVRYLWYCYYIPMLMLPQLSFQGALSVGRPAEEKLPWIQRLTGAVSVIFILFILTNDLHEQVFGFRPGYVNCVEDYTHGSLFWVIVVYNYIFLVTAVLVLFRKCTVYASRRLAWIPVVYVLCFVVWSAITLMNLRPVLWGQVFWQFPETTCFMMGGMWVLAICIGLVPSNRNYGRLFEQSGFAAQIADSSFRIVYSSRSAQPLRQDQLRACDSLLLQPRAGLHEESDINKNLIAGERAGYENEGNFYGLQAELLLTRQAISGGYVYWQTDVSEINRLNRQLADIHEALAEEAELVKYENRLHEQQIRLEEKNRLYDSIAARVLPQSRAIRRLAELEADAAFNGSRARLICIYAAYIKRMTNLMLLAAQRQRLELAELYLSLQESLHYLRKAGIPAEMNADFRVLPGQVGTEGMKETDEIKGTEGMKETDSDENSLINEKSELPERTEMPSERILEIYERFQQLLELALPGLRGLYVNMTACSLKLALEGVEIGHEMSVTDDGTSFVTIPFERGDEG